MALQEIQNQKISNKLFNLINGIFLIIFTAIVVFPFYNSVILSFNNGIDARKGGIYFWPRMFTLENYEKILGIPIFAVAARNTILRTIVGTIVSVLFTAFFAYAISKKDLIFKKFYMILGLITMYFGGGLIPTFILIRDLKLYDNFLVYILPSMFSIFNAVILLSFFRTLPDSLEESAKLDGANDLIIFFKIIMPISAPAFATIALFNGIGHWNSWYDTMLYTRNENLETLSHMFTKMVLAVQYIEELAASNDTSAAKSEVSRMQSSATSTTLQLAAMVVTTFPIIVLYPFLQKYFVKGIMIGAIKG